MKKETAPHFLKKTTSDVFDDQKLMLRVADKQDKEAFSSLFHYYAPRLKSFLLQQNCTIEQAEEIIQQTMITLWEKAPLYDPKKAKLSTWLFTIARRKKIDLYRHNKRHTHIDMPFDTVEMSYKSEQDNIIEQKENKKTIHQALSKLSPDQAKILHLSFFEQLSHKMISEKLNIPLGTVKSRIRLGLDKLKHHFKQKEDTHV